MCRAVWVILVAPPDVAPRLRRAVGAEAQVVDVAETVDALAQIQADVVIVDAGVVGAAAGVGRVRAQTRSAIVWIGEDPPDAAHHAVAYDEDLEDALPGAITKALIARNATGRTT